MIGAGLVGLSAAYELTQLGHDVTILEARTRPGGRVYTVREPFSDGLWVEHGAMFIPSTHDLTLKYAALFNLPLEPHFPPPRDLRTVEYLRGKRLAVKWPEEPEWPFDLTAEERMLGIRGMYRKYLTEALDPDAAQALDFSETRIAELDRVSYQELFERNGASPGALALIARNQLWGEGIDTVSALCVLRDGAHLRASQGAQHIKGGNDQLPRAFAAKLAEKIRYGAPVVRIEHSASGVRVTFRKAGGHHTLAADHLVCAIPFSVLRDIEISPRFSLYKLTAITRLRYFSARRTSLQSRTRFWIDQGFDGFANTDLPIRNVSDMTVSQPGPRGVLHSYAFGAEARGLSGVDDVLGHMEMVYPGIKENFEGGYSKSWDSDEWSRGASSWYRPGEMSALWPHIAKPEGRVHFAGDHTSAWIRWMQGALHSGNRVTWEIDQFREEPKQ